MHTYYPMRNAMSTTPWFAVLAGVVLLAACARDETAPPAGPAEGATASAAAPAACALVTAATGEAALGEAVNEPVEQIINPGSAGMAAVSQCTIQASATPGKTLSVFFRVSPVADNRPESVRSTLTESGVTVEDVAGVGDAALWAASELHVFFGDNRYLIVGVRGLDDAAAREQAKAVASEAIGRAG
jgi:hypothetical protein